MEPVLSETMVAAEPNVVQRTFAEDKAPCDILARKRDLLSRDRWDGVLSKDEFLFCKAHGFEEASIKAYFL